MPRRKSWLTWNDLRNIAGNNEKGVRYTESTAYIFEWPIIGIVIIGVSMAIIHGALWVKSRKGDV